MLRLQSKRNVVPYLFLLPWILGLLLFTAGPLLMSLVMSFFDWPVIGEMKFRGLGNFYEMFVKDKQFWSSLRISLTFTAIFVPLKIVIALFLAHILTKPLRFSNIFRTIFYLPTVVSSVAIAIIWSWLLNTEYGIVNYALEGLGIQGPDWLNNTEAAFATLMLASVWAVGGLMLIFYTAMRSIPSELYEASLVDGAGPVRTFFKITLPLLGPTLLFNIITSVIGTLQSLDLVMLLTKGGPLNSTYMYGLFVYNNAFKNQRLGYAAANAWFMFVVIVILTAVLFYTSRYWVYTKRDTGRGNC